MINQEDRVIAIYRATQSLKAVERSTGLSTGKVRKILITTKELVPTKHTTKILELYEAGMSAVDIAKRLGISQKAVAAHLPYVRGQYGLDDATQNAKNIRAWRSKARTQGDCGPE